MKSIKLKVLDEGITLPKYQTTGSAGMDLMANIDKYINVEPNGCKLIPTGIAIHMEDNNMAAMILPRSGLGHKEGIILGNGIGLIDSDYQGQILISCYNRSNKTYTIQPKQRIAQIVFIPITQVKFDVVDEFNLTQRSSGGFGHTGN